MGDHNNRPRRNGKIFKAKRIKLLPYVKERGVYVAY